MTTATPGGRRPGVPASRCQLKPPVAWLPWRLPYISAAHASGDDILKVGLIGCGGRGTGRGGQCTAADARALVAVADAFPWRIEESLPRYPRRSPAR